MKFINLSIIILTLTCSALTQSNLYNLILHSQERGAACLDGSPPGLYIHQGIGNNKNKFMIYFDSGGFCGAGSLSETLQSCYKRSSTSLGTTKNYKPQKDFDGQGLLSTKKEDNPTFYDWTKIFVIYCDGSEYLGNRQNPIPYKDAKLYFRGTKNVLEQFRYLQEKQNFYNGQTIVITGVSAGGMATYQWSNYLFDHTKSAKVFALPDSGFFITDYYSPIVKTKVIRTRGSNLLSLIDNDTADLPDPVQKCLQKEKFDLVDCLNSGNYAEFLKVPTFIIQSPYDSYSLDNILVVQCLKNTRPPYSLENCNDTTRQDIQDYRTASFQYFEKMKGNRTDVGFWSPACVQHGYSDAASYNHQSYKVDGLTLAAAVQEFLDNPNSAKSHIDIKSWPANVGCSGIPIPSLRVQ